jgi:hypothetical protein
MNNLSSYCGLVDAKIRASGKDLPVLMFVFLASNLVAQNQKEYLQMWILP